MKKDERYIEQLEKLIINKLLPIYDKYYELVNLPKPELDIPFSSYKRNLPILLRADLGHLLRIGETQESNK